MKETLKKTPNLLSSDKNSEANLRIVNLDWEVDYTKSPQTISKRKRTGNFHNPPDTLLFEYIIRSNSLNLFVTSTV